ncbi:MAG: hypothetical protein WKF65_08615 [Gaiellaceae bacterium]
MGVAARFSPRYGQEAAVNRDAAQFLLAMADGQRATIESARLLPSGGLSDEMFVRINLADCLPDDPAPHAHSRRVDACESVTVHKVKKA